jgi:hypothetical protein
MAQPFAFVLGIIIIAIGVPVIAGTLGGIAKRWIQLKEKQLDHAAMLAADKAAAQAGHVERLEERMRVLERIVTDRGIAVADEIEQLRDDRVN